VLISRLLVELVEAGVQLAATPNPLPDKVGEGRFQAIDFLPEIQSLSAHFDVRRIDGRDCRHRGLPVAPEADRDVAVRRRPWPDAEVARVAGERPGGVV
jgi:cell division protein ZapE